MITIAQHYSQADDLAHIQALLPYFHDPRYIRIQNKPLFLVYRSSAMPDLRATTTLWRQQAQASGLEGLYLVKVESIPTERQRRPELDGFDAALDFQPGWGSLLSSSPITAPLEPAQQARPGPPSSFPHLQRVLLARGGNCDAESSHRPHHYLYSQSACHSKPAMNNT